MTILFCKNPKCGSPLQGKQRKFCSPKCKMQINRTKKGNGTVTDSGQKQAVSSLNSDTANLFSLFGNDTLPQNRSGISQLKMHLVNQAKYSDEWINRLLNGPVSYNRQDTVEAQQVLSTILWRLLDDLADIEAVTK